MFGFPTNVYFATFLEYLQFFKSGEALGEISLFPCLSIVAQKSRLAQLEIFSLAMIRLSHDEAGGVLYYHRLLGGMRNYPFNTCWYVTRSMFSR